MLSDIGKKMNIFFKGHVAAGFDVMKTKVDEDMAGEAAGFVSGYNLADLGDGNLMMCANVTDFEKMGAFMNTPERLQWEKDVGATYKTYTLEEIQG